MMLVLMTKKLLARNLTPAARLKLKSLLLKTGLFEKGPLLSHLAARLWPSKFEALHRRRTFQAIYKNNHWGSDGAASFYSGVGSRGEVVDIYVEHMSSIIRQHQRELGRSVRVLDLGCGDFTVGRQLTERIPEMSYIGCDIVPELIQHHAETEANSRISFRRLDIVTDDLPNADVVLARQVLQHLPNADVECILQKLGKYRAAYITEGQPATAEGPFNPDKPIGSGMRFNWQTGHGRGLEFDKPPFNRSVREICRTTSTPLGQIVTFQVSDQPLQTDPVESAVGVTRQSVPVLTSSETGASQTPMS